MHMFVYVSRKKGGERERERKRLIQRQGERRGIRNLLVELAVTNWPWGNAHWWNLGVSPQSSRCLASSALFCEGSPETVKFTRETH